MTRSVPEWIATHDDQAIPPRVKLRIFERERGKCHLTGRKILPGEPFDYEHRIALCNGGEHRESNICLALRDKHREKTAEDVGVKSKTARVRAKHLGLWPKPARKLRGRGFPKRFGNGTTKQYCRASAMSRNKDTDNIVPIRETMAVRGVGRDAEEPRAVIVYFTRRLTDDQLRFFHDVCERSAMLFPED